LKRLRLRTTASTAAFSTFCLAPLQPYLRHPLLPPQPPPPPQLALALERQVLPPWLLMHLRFRRPRPRLRPRLLLSLP
jgi:hypothetical protein